MLHANLNIINLHLHYSVIQSFAR